MANIVTNNSIKERYMLILTLTEGEAIHIAENLVIRFSDIHKSQIKLGIDAPRSLQILRAETKSTDKLTKK